MATSKEPGVDLAKLTEPFPREAIKQRQAGGGRALDYVEGHTVIHRLNDATANCWDMTVKSIESKQVGDGTLMMAHVALTLPGLGTREGLGVQMVHARGGEDLVKGCITDGLKKAATLFGVGLELYGPDYAEGEIGPESRPPARVANFSRDTASAAPRPVNRAQEGNGGQHNWQDFWTWARSQNLGSPQAIEGLIGQPTSGLSPNQIRDAIQQAQAPQNGNGGQPVQAGANGITPKQRGWLPNLLAQKGVEDVSAFLWDRFAVITVDDLSKDDASRAIDELQKWPNKPRAEPQEQAMFQGLPPADEPPY